MTAATLAAALRSIARIAADPEAAARHIAGVRPQDADAYALAVIRARAAAALDATRAPVPAGDVVHAAVQLIELALEVGRTDGAAYDGLEPAERVQVIALDYRMIGQRVYDLAVRILAAAGAAEVEP